MILDTRHCSAPNSVASRSERSTREALRQDVSRPAALADLCQVVVAGQLSQMSFDRIAVRPRGFRERDRQEMRCVRLDVNRKQVIQDRRSGMSLTQVAKKHRISRASVCRLMKEASASPVAAAPAFVGNVVQQASAAGVV